MPTLRELTQNPNPKLSTDINFDKLNSALGINDYYWPREHDRLTAFWIKVHRCTDTWVGIMAYYLDGELVAVSNQPYRKADEVFEFVTEQKVKELKTYIQSLMEHDNNNFCFVDLDEDFGDTYCIEYSEGVIHKTALFGDVRVKIVNTFRNDPKNFHDIKIELPDGKQMVVKVGELSFQYNTLD
jgi:hypothetical protein